MQQIERYGVIALVFLLVTIVAVSFWGDGKSPGFWSRLTGRGAKKDPPAAQIATLAPAPDATERAIDGELPLSPATEPPAQTPPSPSSGWESTPVHRLWEETLAQREPPASAPVQSREPSLALPPPTRTTPPRSETAVAAAGPEYVVKKGDNLVQIASRALGNGKRWREIQALNGGVDPKSLRVGMRLALPASAQMSKAAQPTSNRPATTSPSKHASRASGTYVVRAGDTLASIAKRILGDEDRWKEISAANPGLEPRRLFVGKTLKMPARNESTLLAAAQPSVRPASAPVPASRSSRSDDDRPRVR